MSIDNIALLFLGVMVICAIIFIFDSLLMRKRVKNWGFPVEHVNHEHMRKHNVVETGLSMIVRWCAYICVVLLILKLSGVP